MACHFAYVYHRLSVFLVAPRCFYTGLLLGRFALPISVLVRWLHLHPHSSPQEEGIYTDETSQHWRSEIFGSRDVRRQWLVINVTFAVKGVHRNIRVEALELTCGMICSVGFGLWFLRHLLSLACQFQYLTDGTDRVRFWRVTAENRTFPLDSDRFKLFWYIQSHVFWIICWLGNTTSCSFRG